LVDPRLSEEEQARRIFEAPFAVLSHDTAPERILNYANRTGLRIFELTWMSWSSCLPGLQRKRRSKKSERAFSPRFRQRVLSMIIRRSGD
jgi:MEKHLA domain